MTDDAQDQAREKEFDNVDEVIEHLAAGGYIAKKSTVYRHRKEGKLLPKDTGKFRQKDVERYAKGFLKEASTGQKTQTFTDQLQRKKLEQELKTLELDYERKKFQQDREHGRYIEREKMEIELAVRAGILEAGLKHWVQSRVADWIRASEGDVRKAGELIGTMIRDLDEHINSYAQAREYELVIDGEEDESDDVSVRVEEQ